VAIKATNVVEALDIISECELVTTIDNLYVCPDCREYLGKINFVESFDRFGTLI
jgi:hypothetical protein